MNINTALYGYLTTDRQKKRFYRVKKLEKLNYIFYKRGYCRVFFFLDKKIVKFGKWYI